jgi:disulfide bond formation protein DsbB
MLKAVKLINKKLSAESRILPVALAGFALSSSLFAQYIMNLQPCFLCLLQRYIFLAIFVVGFIAFVNNQRLSRLAIICSLLLFVANSFVAIYHSAVERKLISLPATCSQGVESGTSLEQLKAAILAAPSVRCDEPAIRVIGLSMAEWNVFYSGLAAYLIFYTSLQRRSAVL